MSTFHDLRKIALSLPLSYEDLHFGGPAFRVNKRKFAYLSALGRDGRLADDWRFLYPALATESPPRRVRR